MVQLTDANPHPVYQPLDITGPRGTIFTEAGSVTNGNVHGTPVVPLVLELDKEKLNGKFTAFRAFEPEEDLLAQIAPVYQRVRDIVRDALLQAYQTHITSVRIQNSNLHHAEVLGNQKLLALIMSSEAGANVIRPYLVALTRFFRNNLSEESYYAWTGEGVNLLGTTNRLQNDELVLQVDIPIADMTEVTAFRAKKLQWLAIQWLNGFTTPAGVLRWLQFADNTATLGEEIYQDDAIHFTNETMLKIVDTLSDRPNIANVPDVFAYLADRLIEYYSFMYTRNSMRPSSWFVELNYYLHTFDMDPQVVTNMMTSLVEHHQDSQVHNEAPQGSLTWKLVPVCGYSLIEQYGPNNQNGNPGVQLTRILPTSLRGENTQLLELYRPRRINKFNVHATASFNRYDNRIHVSDGVEDGAYFTLSSLQPLAFSVEVPPYDDQREDKRNWNLVYNIVHNTLFTRALGLSDCIGLTHISQGKLYSFAAEKSFYVGHLVFKLPDTRDNPGDVVDQKGEFEWIPDPYNRKSPDTGFGYAPSGVNYAKLFDEWFHLRKGWKTLVPVQQGQRYYFHNTDLLTRDDRYTALREALKEKGVAVGKRLARADRKS